MAITLTGKKKTQKNLLLFFLVALVIIFIILYSQFFAKQELPIDEGNLVEPVRTIKINFEVLDNSLFLRLKSFSDSPATPTAEELGRENPFYPYSTTTVK
jgi:hypothetical protein